MLPDSLPLDSTPGEQVPAIPAISSPSSKKAEELCDYKCEVMVWDFGLSEGEEGGDKEAALCFAESARLLFYKEIFRNPIQFRVIPRNVDCFFFYLVSYHKQPTRISANMSCPIAAMMATYQFWRLAVNVSAKNI